MRCLTTAWKTFGLLFRESISYGFRRNLWGLKPIGLPIALACACASTAALAYNYVALHEPLPPQVVIVAAVTWIFALLWIAWITRSWVRITADAYGRQLLAACDTLPSSGAAAPKRANKAAVTSKSKSS